tara:strand:+ start:460 stop:657 length:198 start_codon:yes stop_codon:yes gene_type:complete
MDQNNISNGNNVNIRSDLNQSVENTIQMDLYANTGHSVTDIQIFNMSEHDIDTNTLLLREVQVVG